MSRTLVSKGAYARLKGRSPAAVSNWIAKGQISAEALVGEGQRAKVWVELADQDLARSLDPGQQLGRAMPPAQTGAAAVVAASSPPAGAAANGYSAERERGVALDNEMKRIALERERRSLLPIEDVTDAMAQCAEVMVREIDQLPAIADDVATALAREGVDGARKVLRAAALQMRQRLAEKMRVAAAGGEAGTSDRSADDAPMERLNA